MNVLALFTCHAFAERQRSVYDTWFPAATARGYRTEIFDGNRLGVRDDYESLPVKTQALFRWAVAEGVERLVKIDDDTYVNMARFEIPNVDYGGQLTPPSDDGSGRAGAGRAPAGTHPFPYAGGGAYVVSRRAMEILARAPINDWAEDRWVGNTLARNGVQLTPLPGWLFVNWGHRVDEYLHPSNVVIMQIPSVADLRRTHAWIANHAC